MKKIKSVDYYFNKDDSVKEMKVNFIDGSREVLSGSKQNLTKVITQLNKQAEHKVHVHY